MGKPSKAVMDFMAQYGVESDEIWEVHGSTWVVKHKALERVAVEVGIVWLRPSVQVCDLANKIAVICAFGKLGEREEWSFGEASPANNKNSYPMAMAEKRSRDRVILKLLVTHGALYSESEADDFAQPAKRQIVHDTLPEDIGEVPDEDLVTRSDGIQVLTVDAQRPIYTELQMEISTLETVEDCKRWTLTAKSRASRLSDSWRKMLNTDYLKHLRQLEKRDADEYATERMTG